MINLHNAVDFFFESAGSSSDRIPRYCLAASGPVRFVAEIFFGADALHVGYGLAKGHHVLTICYEEFKMRAMIKIAEIKHGEHPFQIFSG